MSTPTTKCPNCAHPAEYVRTRYFQGGSSQVFWCGNRNCKLYDMYFQVDGKDVCQECGGAGQFMDFEGMNELCPKCMGDGGAMDATHPGSCEHDWMMSWPIDPVEYTCQKCGTKTLK